MLRKSLQGRSSPTGEANKMPWLNLLVKRQIVLTLSKYRWLGHRLSITWTSPSLQAANNFQKCCSRMRLSNLRTAATQRRDSGCDPMQIVQSSPASMTSGCYRSLGLISYRMVKLAAYCYRWNGSAPNCDSRDQLFVPRAFRMPSSHRRNVSRSWRREMDQWSAQCLSHLFAFLSSPRRRPYSRHSKLLSWWRKCPSANPITRGNRSSRRSTRMQPRLRRQRKRLRGQVSCASEAIRTVLEIF